MKKIAVFCAVLLAETVVLLAVLLSGGRFSKPLIEWSAAHTAGGSFAAAESRLGEETVRQVNAAFTEYTEKVLAENPQMTFLPEITASGEDVFVLTFTWLEQDETRVLHMRETVQMWVTADENDAVTVTFQSVTPA